MMPSKTFCRLLSLLASSSILLATAESQAADPAFPMGQKSQLVVDQISGFRMNIDGNLSYSGPLGFSTRSYSETLTTGNGDATYHFFTWWLAPSADYFVVDNVSIGALVEVSQTSGSVDFPTGGGATQSLSQPTSTNLTFLPRVGYFLPLGERFGFWPRLGFGYVSRQRATTDNTNPQNQTKNTFGAFLFDIDAGLVLRISDYLFFKIAPEISFSLSGSHTVDAQGQSRSANANVFQLAGVTGIGGIIPL